MCENNEIIVEVFEPTLQGIMTALLMVYPVIDETEAWEPKLLTLLDEPSR